MCSHVQPPQKPWVTIPICLGFLYTGASYVLLLGFLPNPSHKAMLSPTSIRPTQVMLYISKVQNPSWTSWSMMSKVVTLVYSLNGLNPRMLNSDTPSWPKPRKNSAEIHWGQQLQQSDEKGQKACRGPMALPIAWDGVGTVVVSKIHGPLDPKFRNSEKTLWSVDRVQ